MVSILMHVVWVRCCWCCWSGCGLLLLLLLVWLRPAALRRVVRGRYLGLVGFVQLMRSHPKAVVEHRDLVLACLADEDETIRLRSLELLEGMVTKRNLQELVQRLLR